MRRFRDIQVWEKAHSLSLMVYALTQNFPVIERYGLCTQMRRTSASVPSNIAEGCGRSDTEFSRYLEIAMGSANELDYQLLLSRDLGYMTDTAHQDVFVKVIEVQKMLAAFIKKIRSTSPANKRGLKDRFS